MTDTNADPNGQLPPSRGQGPQRCPDCDSPLLPDQRYCLHCGARAGAPRLHFAGFWRHGEAGAAATGGAAAGGSGLAGAAARGATAGGSGDSGPPHHRDAHDGDGEAQRPRSPLPSRKLSAALACVVLAAGVAVGDLIGPGPSNSLASDANQVPVGVLGAVADIERSQRASATPKSGSSAGEEQAATQTQATEEEAPSQGNEEATPPQAGEEASSSAAGAEGSGEESEEATAGKEESTGAGKSGASKSGSSSVKEAPVSESLLQRIKHVWLITLSGDSFKQALAKPSADPYLTKHLVPQGTLLSNYSLVAGSTLANGVALLSGQGSNAATEEDCPTYEPVEPPTLESKGLTEGVGCVYPAAAKTLADQLSEATLSWKAYVQDMTPAEAAASPGATGTTASSPTSETTSSADASSTTSATTTVEAATTETTSATTTTTTEASASAPAAPSAAEASTQTCRHPAIGSAEAAPAPSAGADYQDFANPFAYFDSLLESGACTSNDVGLQALHGDLANASATPSLSWVVPSACEDGQATKCGPKGSNGLAAADAFLHQVVPEITASKPYQQSGLILITFDAGPPAQQKEAGAVVGALLISPFVKRGATNAHEFDTYSLLLSLERLYGVPPLGHATDEGLEELGAGVYSTSAKAAHGKAAPSQGAASKSG